MFNITGSGVECNITFFFGFSSAGFGSPPPGGGGVVFFPGLLDIVEKRSPSSSDDDSPPNRSTAGLDAGLLSVKQWSKKIDKDSI